MLGKQVRIVNSNCYENRLGKVIDKNNICQYMVELDDGKVLECDRNRLEVIEVDQEMQEMKTIGRYTVVKVANSIYTLKANDSDYVIIDKNINKVLEVRFNNRTYNNVRYLKSYNFLINLL